MLDTFLIKSKCRKFYYGPFFYRQQIQPVFDFLTFRAPTHGYRLIPYRGIVEETYSTSEFFREWTDHKWLRQKATDGNVVCQRFLGFIIGNAWTEGSSYDVRPEFDKEAIGWLGRATKQGDRIAADLLQQMSVSDRGKPYYSELLYPISTPGFPQHPL